MTNSRTVVFMVQIVCRLEQCSHIHNGSMEIRDYRRMREFARIRKL